MSMSERGIKAVLLDWSGTTVDHGNRAPVLAFAEVFRQRGIDVTMDEARGPMGRAQRNHIEAIGLLPRVASLWREKFRRSISDADIQAMYEDFIPLQKVLLTKHSDVISGVPSAVESLRAQGVKIGSTTDYSRELMEVVAPLSAANGYAPDIIVCADEVPACRPAPWMNFLAAQRLGIYPMSSIVVVDDTAIGIEAGLNAGAITVAVTKTGNALGLSETEVVDQDGDAFQARMTAIEHEFRKLGAHYVIPSASSLGHLVQHISGSA